MIAEIPAALHALSCAMMRALIASVSVPQVPQSTACVNVTELAVVATSAIPKYPNCSGATRATGGGGTGPGADEPPPPLPQPDSASATATATAVRITCTPLALHLYLTCETSL